MRSAGRRRVGRERWRGPGETVRAQAKTQQAPITAPVAFHHLRCWAPLGLWRRNQPFDATAGVGVLRQAIPQQR